MRPTAPPPELMQRLAASRQGRRSVARSVPERAPLWPLLLRWLIPATAMVVAAAVWRTQTPFSLHLRPQPAAENEPAPKADDVEIGQELVNSFDTVAALPSGEPVRFRQPAAAADAEKTVTGCATPLQPRPSPWRESASAATAATTALLRNAPPSGGLPGPQPIAASVRVAVPPGASAAAQLPAIRIPVRSRKNRFGGFAQLLQSVAVARSRGVGGDLKGGRNFFERQLSPNFQGNHLAINVG